MDQATHKDISRTRPENQVQRANTGMVPNQARPHPTYTRGNQWRNQEAAKDNFQRLGARNRMPNQNMPPRCRDGSWAAPSSAFQTTVGATPETPRTNGRQAAPRCRIYDSTQRYIALMLARSPVPAGTLAAGAYLAPHMKQDSQVIRVRPRTM